MCVSVSVYVCVGMCMYVCVCVCVCVCVWFCAAQVFNIVVSRALFICLGLLSRVHIAVEVGSKCVCVQVCACCVFVLQRLHACTGSGVLSFVCACVCVCVYFYVTRLAFGSKANKRVHDRLTKMCAD